MNALTSRLGNSALIHRAGNHRHVTLSWIVFVIFRKSWIRWSRFVTHTSEDGLLSGTPADTTQGRILLSLMWFTWTELQGETNQRKVLMMSKTFIKWFFFQKKTDVYLLNVLTCIQRLWGFNKSEKLQRNLMKHSDQLTGSPLLFNKTLFCVSGLVPVWRNHRSSVIVDRTTSGAAAVLSWDDHSVRFFSSAVSHLLFIYWKHFLTLRMVCSGAVGKHTTL